jgi:hypothetical protein
LNSDAVAGHDAAPHEMRSEPFDEIEHLAIGHPFAVGEFDQCLAAI